MKKLLFSLAFLMVFGLAFGQEGKTRERSEKEQQRYEQREERRQERLARHEARARERAERAAEITKMTDEQKEVVLDICRQEQLQIQKIIRNAGDNTDLMKEQIKALMKTTNAKIKTIVGPEKYTHYERWFQDSNQEQILQNQVIQEEVGVKEYEEQMVKEVRRQLKEKNKGEKNN